MKNAINHKGEKCNANGWSYIGRLGAGGDLDWGGGEYPSVPTPALPELHETKLYMIIRGLAREGAHGGREVGWGASAIKVNGPKILEILRSVYGDLENVGRIGILAKYVNFARELGSEGFAALIAAEL